MLAYSLGLCVNVKFQWTNINVVFTIMSSKRSSASAAAALPCSNCKQTLVADIQVKLQANHGVLNAENMVIMECLGLADSKELIDMFFNLLIEKQDLQLAPPKSPFKPAIVLVPKDGSFKKIMCPVDVEAFDIEAVKNFLGDFPKPEHWQNFAGQLLIGPNKTFACAACEVEAIPSANKFSLVCPKKVYGNDIKMAQAKGCFVTMKIKIADCIAENQDVITAYNSSKSKPPSTVKSTETLARELVARKRQAFESSTE
jgi:hypothetical protein